MKNEIENPLNLQFDNEDQAKLFLEWYDESKNQHLNLKQLIEYISTEKAEYLYNKWGQEKHGEEWVYKHY